MNEYAPEEPLDLGFVANLAFLGADLPPGACDELDLLDQGAGVVRTEVGDHLAVHLDDLGGPGTAGAARTGSAGGARGSTARRAPAKEHVYLWEGRDRAGKVLRGEMRASGPTVVQTTLRRQGISMTKATKHMNGIPSK